jgi:hypothetical protein
MDESDNTPIPGRSENKLLLIAATGVLAATSPIWFPFAIAWYLSYAGDDGPGWLVAAGGFSVGAFGVWLLVRLINRRDDNRSAGQSRARRPG